MFSNIVKYILRPLVIGSILLECVNFMLIPFSQIAFWGMTWAKVIHGIAIISVVALLVQIAIQNKKSPNIRIKPIVVNRTAILEIHNNGAGAKFNAAAKIIKDHQDRLNEIYTLCWEPEGYKAEIDKDGTGKVIIAYQSFIAFIPLIVGLTMPKMTNEGKITINIAIWPLGEMQEIRIDEPPDDIDLEISITADKNMRKKFSGLIFRLSQKSTTTLQFEYVKSKDKERNLKLDKDGYLK